ncbi:uncharacterized protein GO595_000558 [Histomonas meleagridis]|uniref:uncharacterized protein n=1 Tax=Histomonas meleagridis TaxID=135588 RepID=UPI00355ACB2D|nr:hypothetical protein GO595_000558 [Histomonas meleagridis]
MQDIKKSLEPYTSIYENIQGMLFWRRPIPMLIFLIIVELVFLFTGTGELGFLSVLSMIITFRYIIEIIYHLFGDFITEKLFPPIDKGAEGDPNRIYPLEPFCEIIASVASFGYSAVNRLLFDSTPQGILLAIAVFLFMFIFFWVCGTFNTILVITHLLILAPGILFHPKFYQYTRGFLENLHKFICGTHKKSE